ncbi:MAG: nucleotide sugar dehydrogenase [Desulfobacteraceae bacterium]|jgi:UDP-N-acetyl-D-galactosamine dehydrogenase
MLDYDSLETGEGKIAVVGLGYVGLPLLVHLADHFDVVGFDINEKRVAELASGKDRTGEVLPEDLRQRTIHYTSTPEALRDCRLVIVAVPTPIDAHNRPDLTPLVKSSATVGGQLNQGSCVVYESTVYPGATEEVCVPILEQASGLVFGKGFTVGYSPERINPGDKVHTVDRIVKVVSGSDSATCDLLAKVYGKVTQAGVHKASSIKVAEAAKVIENTQRDLNIALMNELAMIFHRMGINTNDVLEAAGTKWNFLPFRPGLVGGHCIGVDPYYLTFKAESLKYHPEMILAGRRINDGMGKVVAERMVKLLIRAEKQVRKARVAVLGLTFKEDVPDIRNTKVIDIVHELEDYGVEVLVHDPVADSAEAFEHYGIELHSVETLSGADGVIVAVGHQAYRDLGLRGISAMCRDGVPIVLDVKALFSNEEAAEFGIRYGRL